MFDQNLPHTLKINSSEKQSQILIFEPKGQPREQKTCHPKNKRARIPLISGVQLMCQTGYE